MTGKHMDRLRNSVKFHQTFSPGWFHLKVVELQYPNNRRKLKCSSVNSIWSRWICVTCVRATLNGVRGESAESITLEVRLNRESWNPLFLRAISFVTSRWFLFRESFLAAILYFISIVLRLLKSKIYFLRNR